VHVVGLRRGEKKGFAAVLHPGVNIQENKVRKVLEIISSTKTATLKLGLSDRVVLATSCPCFSTPILAEASHNLLPGLAGQPGFSEPPARHAAGEAASPAREPSHTQHGTFQSDKPRPDSKLLSLCKLLMAFPANTINITYGL